MQSHGKDLKGQTLSVFARAAAAATAGGSGDATEITGDTIHVASLADRPPASVVFEIPVSAVLADTESITVTGLIEKSIDGTTWETMVASATLLTMTSDGGSTEKGVARIGADLIQSNSHYIRFKATPDLSASGTDTAALGAAVAVFGGLSET